MVHVRPATDDDREEIWRVHTQAIRVLCREKYGAMEIEAWAGTKTPESYREPLRTRAMYVAERGGRIVGFGQLDRERGEVEAVYVSPDAVRTKVGSALLSRLEQVARESGLREISLKSTLNAEAFYAWHGFEPLGLATHLGLECVRMRKALPLPSS